MVSDIPKFVKWAGGKSQLLEQFKPFFPKEFNNYIEPFVGSGAVFFYVIENLKPNKAVIGDVNEELMLTYEVIRDDVEQLIDLLKIHKDNHMSVGKPYYLKIRALETSSLSKVERAARFIYLNKTCFNGLYRVNSKGKFNVPMGSYKNPDIVQKDKLRRISSLLKETEIHSDSFEKIAVKGKKGDFIYFDPPYYPVNGSKSFTTYTKENFLEEEQRKLAEVFKKMDEKGCYLMLSNSDTEFIKELYKDYNINFVKAKRLINSDANGRGKINEVVITNY